ncbi:MAG: class I SAM-dependent methyltransferase [Acidobacteria bacterium]|nr:class I SAM-dependent methyltransferase [Acidobacteriota bacterium]
MTQKKRKFKTQSFYDRIADVHNLALKINGYRQSVEKFLKSLDLKIDENSMVLDAGSGTGIVTLGFHSAGFRPCKTVALDLSFNSLKLSRGQFKKDKKVNAKNIVAVQGNILNLPFADESFDLVLSCGVLEYVPLDEGLREMSRVLKTGAKLVFIPVRPSLVGSVLELLYNFKTHPLTNVRRISQRYFNILSRHKFPITEPISWSKTIFLLEKK